jgi:hypothetical protein
MDIKRCSRLTWCVMIPKRLSRTGTEKKLVSLTCASVAAVEKRGSRLEVRADWLRLESDGAGRVPCLPLTASRLSSPRGRAQTTWHGVVLSSSLPIRWSELTPSTPLSRRLEPAPGDSTQACAEHQGDCAGSSARSHDLSRDSSSRHLDVAGSRRSSRDPTPPSPIDRVAAGRTEIASPACGGGRTAPHATSAWVDWSSHLPRVGLLPRGSAKVARSRLLSWSTDWD